MSKENKNPKSVNDRKQLDHPEQYPTNEKSLFDQFEAQQHVDPIPMEDLKQELRDEKKKHKTKNDSSSAQKYK